MRITHLGAIDVRKMESENSLPITTRDALVALPNGGFDQDRGMPVFLPNTFNMRLILKESDGITYVHRELQKRISYGRTLLRVIDRDGLQLQTWVKVKDVMRDANVKTYKSSQPLVVTMRQDYPFWLASDDEPLYADSGWTADSGLFADAGNMLEYTVDTTSETGAIDNGGTTVIRRGEIVITVAAASEVTNLRITNSTNASYLEYTGTLTANDVLVIDLLNRSAFLNGVDVYSSITTPDTSEYWLELELDDNTIATTNSSITGTLTVSWQYSRHFL